ncbi:SAM-dependent methyltransferase [Nonomuraea sp. NPDC046802]|uniref:SAM-dependent methyltransferase n=1 Tax=Nonomuraea sp. NPDC046802 TaxID=3154919 RepID=UPI0033FBEAD5
MTRDWQQWHTYYDSPTSSLAQRLNVVRRDIHRALIEAPCDADGVVRLTSICAGEGRDVLPVLAERGNGREVKALLLEIHPALAARAGAQAEELALPGVEVREADAGLIETYLGIPASHVLLVCGVFGNISVDDVRRTIATLPALLAPEGIVIWTRGVQDPAHDPSRDIRDHFAEHGFRELAFTGTEEGEFRVGMHQLAVEPADVRSMSPSSRMFTFL